jgi:hypothetical protein
VRRSPSPALLTTLAVGCAASLDIEGVYAGPAARNAEPPVGVVFVFRHLSQQHGWHDPEARVRGVRTSTTCSATPRDQQRLRYETFTELPDDVNDPNGARSSRRRLGAVWSSRVLESSFKQQF